MGPSLLGMTGLAPIRNGPPSSPTKKSLNRSLNLLNHTKDNKCNEFEYVESLPVDQLFPFQKKKKKRKTKTNYSLDVIR